MKYVGLILVIVGIVALVAVWLTGLSRYGNYLLLIPFALVIGGMIVHVAFQKVSSRY